MTVTAAEFDWVRRLVADESALALGADKEYLVRARLGPLASRHGLDSVSELIGAARAGRAGIRQELVEALFTHETLFFRDEHPFEALRDVVLPERRRAAAGRRLTLWSAATSTGQEAYSLAMLVRESLPGHEAPLLLATDLSAPALARARRGRYSQLEVGRGLPAQMLARHFVRAGDGWQVRDDLRAMVRFERLNLARPFHGVVPAMDVVLLRNVLIYLEQAARDALAREVARIVRPGGWLCLGGAESVEAADDAFERVHCGRTVLYRRREGR